MPLNAIEIQIKQRIAAEQVAMQERLAHMVAIPTGHDFAPGLEAMRTMLCDRFMRLGAEIEEVCPQKRPDWIHPSASSGLGSPTLVARRVAGRTGPTLLIAGHMDTVHDPVGPFQKLQLLEHSRAIGPGAADMKGGIEVALTALEALENLSPTVRWIFVLNADEEAGSFRSAKHLSSVAQECDAGFILEPALNNGGIVVERFGSGQFMIDVVGRAAHSGRDFANGISAVNALAEVIVKIARLSDLSRQRIVNIGPLQGGEATNIVADHARAWGNIRFADAADGQRLISEIQAFSTANPNDLPRITIHHSLNRPAKPCTPEVLALATIAQAIGHDLGLEIATGKTGGVSDGNLIQASGVPCLDGLGVRGGNLHRVDEFIQLDSLSERATLLALILLRVSSDHTQKIIRGLRPHDS